MNAPLPYDDFPVHSTILRERRGDALYITIPASEPDPRALATARMHTAIPAAIWTVAGLAVAAIPFVAMVREIRGRFPASAAVVFIVLVAAVFFLLWRSLYQRRRDELEKAWARAMIIVIRDGEILIEADDASIALGGAKPWTIAIDDGGIFSARLPRLMIEIDGETLPLLQGRDPAELLWIMRRMVQSETRAPKRDGAA
jgi:hypothetical protein